MHKYIGTIIEIKLQSPRVKSFKIKLDSDFSYTPGQFVEVSIDGFNDSNGNIIKRAYSIASSPLDIGYIQLCIARAENGHFSVKMHSLEEGTQLNVEGPFGLFHLAEPVPPGTVFICGGTGISPIMSMLRTLFDEHDPDEFWFFFGFRNPEEFIFKDEILGWKEKFKNLHIVLSINAPVEGWTGDVGYISDVLPKYIKDGKGMHIYFCGPPPMVDATIKRLEELGFEDSNIYREKW